MVISPIMDGPSLCNYDAKLEPLDSGAFDRDLHACGQGIVFFFAYENIMGAFNIAACWRISAEYPAKPFLWCLSINAVAVTNNNEGAKK